MLISSFAPLMLDKPTLFGHPREVLPMALTSLEQAILVDLLIHGDDKAGNIGDRTNHHRNSVSDRLANLRGEGYVRRKGEGTHELTDRGRDFARSYARSNLEIYQGQD